MKGGGWVEWGGCVKGEVGRSEEFGWSGDVW